MAFTSEQLRVIEGLLDSRLKSVRHTNADHLDRALLAQKLNPGDAAGRVLSSDGSDVSWAGASGLGVDELGGPAAGAGDVQSSLVRVVQSLDDLREEFSGHGHGSRFIDEVEMTTQSTGAGDKLSLAVVNDGRRGVILDVVATCSTTTAPTGISLRVGDGAGGTGSQYSRVHGQTAAANGNVNLSHSTLRVDPWVGTKTFYLYLNGGGGTLVMYGTAQTAPGLLRANWAE